MKDKDEINIGHLSTMYHTSFILMGKKWIEERLNLKVNWELFGTGPDIVKAFSKKEIDIGYIGLPPAIIGIDNNISIKCVAGGHVEGTVFIGRGEFRSLEELGGDMNSTLHQFEGRVIGTPSKGSIHDVIVRNIIKEEGLEEEMTLKNFEWADFIPESMKDGEIDAACGTPPLSVACSRICNSKIILPPNKLWPDNPSYGILASFEMIEKYPDLVEGFLKLHEEASNLIRANPGETAKIVSNEVGLVDEDFVKETYKISPKYCAALSDEYIGSSMAFVPVLHKLGYIKKPLRKEDIFYAKFIQKIHPGPHHYNNLIVSF